MMENEEKNEIIEANYAWTIHLTICSKLLSNLLCSDNK